MVAEQQSASACHELFITRCQLSAKAEPARASCLSRARRYSAIPIHAKFILPVDVKSK